MARTVDPARHQARRLVIIDAALTCFAVEGFDRATTAAICRAAGIGSGTFFHYFPTKLSVLLGILELGTAETAAWFAAQAGRTDAAGVIADYVAHAADECADPRVAGFVKAIGAVMADPDVSAALGRDEAAVHDGLLPWVGSAQEAGQVRADVPAARLCAWIMVVLDGFTGRIAGEPAFSAATERDMLIDTVRRLLAPTLDPE
jgi:AcrR family transcriptional regulator